MRNATYTNHESIFSAQAEGALTARSFVKKGTTNLEAQPIATTDNEPVIGWVDEPYDDNAMASIMKQGRIEAISDGAVNVGDWVVTGNAVNSVQTVANLAAADKAILHIVGQCVEVYGDGAGANGKTVGIDLQIYDTWYAA